MRRSLTVLAVVSAVLGLMAAPAMADRPVVETEEVTFGGFNPCTEQDNELTVIYETRIHDHGHNSVVTSKTTGTSDDGFVLKGVEREIDSEIVEGTGIFHFSFKDVWRSPTTGEAYIVHLNLVIDANTDTTRVVNFSERCLGA